MNTFRIARHFSERYRPPIFSTTMSRNRFFFILTNLSLYDEETCADCYCERTAWIVQWTMLKMPKGMWLPVRWWNSMPYVQSDFIQTIQSERASKIWIAFQVNQDWKIILTFVSAPYAGKPQNEGGKFYRTGIENVTKYLTDCMADKRKLEGRNISFDRLYTLFTLATWLLNEKHVTYIGTLMANKKGIPPDVNKIQYHEIESIILLGRTWPCLGILCRQLVNQEEENCVPFVHT